MSDCRRIESLLPPYVDGEASAEAVAAVNAHLASCGACRDQVAAERSVRTVLRARAASLGTPAPPGLRNRIDASRAPAITRPVGWRRPVLAGGALAAMVLVTVTAFEFVSPRSNLLFGARLALDHVRCFVIEFAEFGSRGDEVAEMRQQYAERDGWDVPVPPSSTEAGLRLVAARRCPFGVGDHAHLLYRAGDRKVSLYVTPGETRTRDERTVLGHVERIWASGGSSFTLVARGLSPAELDRIAGYLERQTR